MSLEDARSSLNSRTDRTPGILTRRRFTILQRSSMMLKYLVVASVMVMLVISSGVFGEREVLTEIPSQPMVFNSPEELRNYLEELDKYFIIAGRPRFGRSFGGPRLTFHNSRLTRMGPPYPLAAY